jgi:aspartate ammonia-lyase
MRKEIDFLGEKEIPDNVLYGIHSIRAKENFSDKTPFQIDWYRALGTVKRACYETYKTYKSALLLKFEKDKILFPLMDDQIIDKLIESAIEVENGKHFEHFIIPAFQGGAGTSTNMNVNEILANAALIKMGKKPGEYNLIDPIEHANIYQSTNDVIPTSLKLCIIKLLLVLENEINNFRKEVELLESKYRSTLRIGYTQMQEAVPTTYGRLFSTYNEALSRDWWRVSKCIERIKTVNLGGSAIGTGITVPRFFILEVVKTLQHLSGLPLTHAENMSDATSNLDSLVEVHAILKAHAVNLEKMVNDLRLLASDIAKNEISIPQKQVGSSIMPGKINPVIPEFVISAAHQVYANDMLVSSLCAQGCLELNAYIPTIGNAIIGSLKLLTESNITLRRNFIGEITINTQVSASNLYKSSAITTALIVSIGYHKATELAKYMKQNNKDIFEANKILKTIDEEKLKALLAPDNILKEGFTVEDFKLTN